MGSYSEWGSGMSIIEDATFELAAREEQMLVDLLRKHLLQDFRTPESLWKAGYILHIEEFGDGKKRATLAKIVDSQSYELKVNFFVEGDAQKDQPHEG